MTSPTRKRALQDYKQRTPERGAFALRCAAANRVWVGTSMNLTAARNGTLFVLRHGQHRDTALQALWNTCGEAAFAFDIVERLADDVAAVFVADRLKDIKHAWVTRLGATPLLP